MRETNQITGEIVDAAYAVHTEIGPGLLESAYEAILAQELEQRGLSIERQRSVSFEFKGSRFEHAFRVDLLVAGLVVVELKSVEKLAPVHTKQVLTYLRLMKLPVGLLTTLEHSGSRMACIASSMIAPRSQRQPLSRDAGRGNCCLIQRNRVRQRSSGKFLCFTLFLCMSPFWCS